MAPSPRARNVSVPARKRSSCDARLPDGFRADSKNMLLIRFISGRFDHVARVINVDINVSPIAKHFEVQGLFCCVVQMLVYIFAFGFALISCAKFRRELGH